jgi:hypothetical protein
VNTLQRVEDVCDVLGFQFRTVGDAVVVQFGAPAATVVVRARDLVVTLDRPCGIILRSAMADAIREANRLNAEFLPAGAFSVRERDRLLSFGLPLVAPFGLTPEQLDIGLAAVVLNPFPRRFAPYLEVTVGYLDSDRWWDGVA